MWIRIGYQPACLSGSIEGVGGMFYEGACLSVVAELFTRSLKSGTVFEAGEIYESESGSVTIMTQWLAEHTLMYVYVQTCRFVRSV